MIFKGLSTNPLAMMAHLETIWKHHLINVTQKEEYIHAIKEISAKGKYRDPFIFGRLQAAGLVKGVPPSSVQLACELYRRYFNKIL